MHEILLSVLLYARGYISYSQAGVGPHAFTGLSNTTGNLLPATSQTVDYTVFNKASYISQGNLDYFIIYPDRLRRKTQLNSGIGDDVLLTKYYAFGDYEKETDASGTRELHYISGGDGLAAIYVKNDGGVDSLYFIMKDHLGSIVGAINSENEKVYKQSFDAWGRKRNPENWSYTNIPDFPFDRGFTGHSLSRLSGKHLKWFGLINMNGRMYDAALCRFLSPDPFVQMPDYSQNFNRYSYALNNPLVYTDPSGDFLTWSFGNGGFSIGFNFTPIGIPLGAGLNIGWGEGASLGGYGEVGYRVGGTGFGSGVMVSQSLDYNFKYSGWSTTTSEGAYASLGPFNAGVNFSQTYDMSSKQWSNGWGVSAGVGVGNDASGIGFNVGYGSGGWSYGIGGYYNSKAWESSPVYVPDEWNDNGVIQTTNNCYSYALDDKGNGNYWGLQPGEAGGQPITSASDVNLDYVTNGAISDGRIKKPYLINKLGFGKRGYSSVYLVIDQGVDYHWYRQDKGGNWSHKPGITPVINVDASGRFITNPARANHHYPSVNYNNGGILLWVR